MYCKLLLRLIDDVDADEDDAAADADDDDGSDVFLLPWFPIALFRSDLSKEKKRLWKPKPKFNSNTPYIKQVMNIWTEITKITLQRLKKKEKKRRRRLMESYPNNVINRERKKWGRKGFIFKTKKDKGIQQEAIIKVKMKALKTNLEQ